MGSVAFERSDGVGYVTITREEVFNCLDSDARGEIIETLREYRTDDDIEVIVFRGEGDHFCAGGDVEEFRAYEDTAYGLEHLYESWMRLYSQMQLLRKPTVAVVTGYALGGGLNTLLFTDIVIAAEDATFGLPEVELGFIDPIAAARLPRLVGRTTAYDLLMTGRSLSAAEARELGLVARVATSDDFAEEVAHVVATLRSLSPTVLARMKEVINVCAQMSPDAAFEYAKRACIDEALTNPDADEGIKAFLERREPDWSS